MKAVVFKELRVKRLRYDAILPKYATPGAACFDLHAIVDQPWPLNAVSGTHQSGVSPSRIFPTGLAFEVPEGHVMLVFSRSGHGFRSDVRLANCVGVIDSDYRGEVQVKLTADEGGYLTVNNGDRIAQAMVIPVPALELVEVTELSTTARGAGGLGSTGA